MNEEIKALLVTLLLCCGIGLYAWHNFALEQKKYDLENERSHAVAEQQHQQCIKTFEKDFHPQPNQYSCTGRRLRSETMFPSFETDCSCRVWEVKGAWEKENSRYEGEITNEREIKFNLKANPL